jgi:phosphoenolpyruvate-protein phosphotransferase (PTS system enzyme I)
MDVLQGISASPGIAIGPFFLFERMEIHFDYQTVDDPAAEWQRFEKGLIIAHDQLDQVYQRARDESGEAQAEIFKAQTMILEDPELLKSIRTAVEEQKVNVESALHDATEVYAQMLEALEDEYLSARALDVRDVSARLLRILLGIAESPTADLDTPSIIVAQDLTPSDTVLIDKSCVLGFCTADGGATSHTAILARGLGLPAVVGAGPEVLGRRKEDMLILDGSSGELFINPDPEFTETYRQKQNQYALIMAKAQEKAHEPAITVDGHRVEVVANIGNVEGAESAIKAGAEGVGLLRSEFLYLERPALPDEEEQYQAYKAIASEFGSMPVILRTLDIGGDKELAYLNLPPEQNPFLGVRAIRLCLERPDLFKPQLRAALRAAAGNNLKLMFPMVATVGEVRQARAVLEECRQELEAEGQVFAESIDIGIMIEIPAAAVMADHLAKEVDFFSIGTNDLSQYTMAVDRTNAQVASLASSFQPAVLRLIKQVIDAAHAQGKWVGLCGELAGEPLAIPILLGLGLDEFSMNPPAIAVAKQIIRSLSLKEVEVIANQALQLENSEKIQAFVRSQVPSANIA